MANKKIAQSSDTDLPENESIDKQDVEVNHQHSPTHDQISARAHGLWEEGGRQDGHHALDWERAERELSAP